ncbi:MAG: hypothetical protein ACI4N3_03830 [Alphaproteobacteria bacterium]
MAEKITDLQKEEILNEIFNDQAALLRQFKADDMVEKGIAKTFREAAEKIKAEETAKEKESIKTQSSSLSEQEKDLMEFMSSIRNNKE